ncbi:hypothetical protein V1523DRAFT_403074 [Lipomyces doorenjongii]
MPSAIWFCVSLPSCIDCVAAIIYHENKWVGSKRCCPNAETLCACILVSGGKGAVLILCTVCWKSHGYLTVEFNILPSYISCMPVQLQRWKWASLLYTMVFNLHRWWAPFR